MARKWAALALVAALWVGMCRAGAEYRTYYEIFVGSFCDYDGDGIGDLRGAMSKLDYVCDTLGATGIYLMPVMASPSYHKYDVANYFAVDPEYGTLEDFADLAEECARRGAALILDLPVNHTSSSHPWFVAACESLARGDAEGEYVGYYNFSRERGSGRQPVPAAEGWYYEAQFAEDMPDLNLDNDAVRAEIAKIVRFWLDIGATGFRLDAVTSYYTGAAGKNAEFLAFLKECAGDAYLVGEAWTDGGQLLSLYGSGTDSLFNFPFSQKDGDIISCVLGGRGAALAKSVADWDARLREAAPGAVDAVFLTNHDMVRSAGALRRDPALIKQAAAVYLLMPGNSFIYYGEEIGMRGGSRGDPDKRMPMIWSLEDDSGMADPPEGAMSAETVDAGAYAQAADPGSILSFYARAVAIKSAHAALARGRAEALDAGFAQVCAYEAAHGGEVLRVYHNLGDKASLSGLEGFAMVAWLDAGGESPELVGGVLKMPPLSTAVLAPGAR